MTDKLECGCRRNVRNLVVCIDGTANKFDTKNTNVVQLYSFLVKDKYQLTYYNSGIGTYATPSFKSWSWWKQVVGHKIDLAIAWRFERIIIGAYQWLSEQYQAGDRIYLFGFSRGAYQVRALSAMIDKVGLIHKGNQAQIPFAYELYASIDESNRDPDPSSVPMDRHFKETFSRDVRVHFVGAWDTVSSVGFFRGKDAPFTACGMKHVCHFRHALALDERRVKFQPEYAYGGVHRVQVQEPLTEPAETESHKNRVPHTKEVWFAGTHSDIGGGSVRNDEIMMSHSGPPFRWMSYEAIQAGIRLKPYNGKWPTKELKEVHESLTTGWKLLEYLPIKRRSYKDTSDMTWWPNRGNGRRVVPGQMIHKSVFSAHTESYVSRAHLPMSTGAPTIGPLKGLHNDAEERTPLEAVKGKLEMCQVSLEDDFDDLVLDLLSRPQDLKSKLSSAEYRRKLVEAKNAAGSLIPLFLDLIKSELNPVVGGPGPLRLLVLGVEVNLFIYLAQYFLGHSRFGPNKNMIVITRSEQDPELTPGTAHFSLRMDGSEKLRLHNLHPDFVKLSYFPAFPPFALPLLLSAAARWRWYMDQSPRTDLLCDTVKISVEFNEIFDYDPYSDQNSEEVSEGDRRPPPRRLGSNLVEDDVVKVTGGAGFGDRSNLKYYGITITNESEIELYPYTYMFNSDLSFGPYGTKPLSFNTPPLLPGQSLRLQQGGGTGPPAFFILPPGETYDVSFLKIIVTRTFVDLSHFIQLPPSEISRRIRDQQWVGLGNAFPTDTGELQNGEWGTKLIKVIQHRAKDNVAK